MTDTYLATAQREGFIFGAHRSGLASDCPHGHHRAALRRAWFEGFSNGRRALGLTSEAVLSNEGMLADMSRLAR